MNIIENLKKTISEKVEKGYNAAVEAGELLKAEADIKELIKLEIPKEKAHGDFASNLAMLLAKELKMPPRKIAEAIEAHIEKDELIEKTEVAGAGFINFCKRYRRKRQIHRRTLSPGCFVFSGNR